jgi:hypothetical protein
MRFGLSAIFSDQHASYCFNESVTINIYSEVKMNSSSMYLNRKMV